MNLTDVISRKDMLSGKIESLLEQKSFLEKKLKELEENYELYKQASIIVENAVTATHNSLRTNITRVADDVLGFVFPEAYKTEIVFESRGKNTKTSQAFLKLCKNGVEISGKNLTTGIEGASLAILSIALRLSFLLLKHGNRRILLLDEVLGPLSNKINEGEASNLGRALDVLKILSEKFDCQIILVHHFNG